jgi:hypothetical protein
MQKFLCFLMLSLSLSTQLFAQHAGDIEVTLESNKIVTNERVYGFEFGVDSTYTASDPGYDAIPGTFPFPSTVGFNILGQLKVWDGFDFDAVATPRIKIITPVAPFTTNTISPTTNTVESGFSLNVLSTGEWHRHPVYELVDSAGASLSDPPLQFPGIYMLSLELKSSDPGITNSDPFYLVFNNGMPEVDHLAAEAFVNANVVPEPSTWAVLLMAGFGSAVAWKRRRVS